ncbi:RelE family toxin-antitoxin system [Klebsiella pneumoniae]|nr:RelE family toxin-antitoxin system [Klebsiella pneumoniae]
MTDITELAQREKFEAWFKSSFHPDKTGPYIKDQLYFAWKAASAELVEALESEKRICATWRKTAEANSEKLEKAQAKTDVYDMLRDDYGLREKGVGLADFVDWQANRIAELESRAVIVENLQESAYRAGLTAGWNLGLANNNDGFNKCLAAHAAGIKVEVE